MFRLSLKPSHFSIPARTVTPITLSRSFFFSSSSSASMPATTAPRFSPGTDAAAAQAALEPLTAAGSSRSWALASEGEALERSFRFRTFAKTWDFMTAVSLQCKTKNHHPEWSNVYNTTFIRWTTHNPKGLSDKDLSMAKVCDALARDFGELEPPPESESALGSESASASASASAACGIKGLADRAAGSAGDCCGPKKQ